MDEAAAGRLLNGRSLESEETGRYRCTAENGVGRIEREFQVKHYGKATGFGLTG